MWDDGDEGSSGGSEDGVGIVATERTVIIDDDDGGKSSAKKMPPIKGVQSPEFCCNTKQAIAFLERRLVAENYGVTVSPL